MKILITSVVDLETSAPGRLHHFIEYLSKENDITVISLKDFWKAKQTSQTSQFFLPTLRKINLIHPFSRPISPPLQEFLSIFKIKSILQPLNPQKFDLHFNYNSLALGWITTKYLKKFNIPTIYDLADDLPAMAAASPQVPSVLRPLAKFLSSYFMKKNISLSKKVTLTCQTLAETLNIPQDKSVIIPNGVTLSRFSGISRLNQIPTQFQICYIGVLREWVDFSPVFNALQKLQPKYNFKFVIAGKEGQFSRLQSQVSQMGLSQNVEFLGSVPYHQIPALLASSQIGILPFKNNDIARGAFPLKILEYAAAGLPIVSSPLPEVKRIMTDKILYAETNKQWQNAFTLAFQDYSRYYQNILDFQPTLKKYDWTTVSQELEKILSTATKSK